MRTGDWVDLMALVQMLLQGIGVAALLYVLGAPWWGALIGAVAATFAFDRVLLRVMGDHVREETNGPAE